MMSNKLKLLAAAAGAGALVTMGGVTIASAEPEPAPPGPVKPTEATMPETSIESPAPSTPTTPSAVPEIKGPAPLPPEQEDAK